MRTASVESIHHFPAGPGPESCRSNFQEFDVLNKRLTILSEYDPADAVNLRDPEAVAASIRAIMDRNYGSGYDRVLLDRVINDLVRCYSGTYSGLKRCDTLYHDLRHALDTGLTMARMIDGDIEAGGRNGPPLSAEQALLGIFLALFHDIGLLRRDGETYLWGAQLLPVHEERGVQFMLTYLWSTSLIGLANKAELIMPTKLTFHIPEDWAAEDRKVASMIGSADLISQMADRCYLEKCRDFLFAEFRAIGLAGRPGDPYPDATTLLMKTPGFVLGLAMDRLNREFGGILHVVEGHFSGSNPYLKAIDRHIDYLGRKLQSDDLDGLRRRPQPFIGPGVV